MYLYLSLLNSVTYLFFHNSWSSSQDFCLLDSISNNIDQAISLHPDANIFVFSNFNAYHTNWLKHFVTDFAGIQTHKFSITQYVTQVVDFLRISLVKLMETLFF